ncbi:MAG: ATP-grasp domain-containing protein [Prolixibacteraceae bacterium]|jgi:biotin carboxylase|nr:ATP-grasp domain-containing protein [Prolixibacteraceae bacterium]MBT6006805.1 ATP-grasp domain-containing protein [Prolixibacteraceae bacterium]MBT6766930.1 ATP-grasp domain-containing protein [Prolixibacteraceae bacterium]MBT7000102.1 ATP-grasp domain-containing protein [Prolixibacteraceae bacterium]MBT7395757.1 ATP-grasp domain-containing protein [Prolixibacteraceae bacterium]
MSQKKILFLGGAYPQIPIIKEAKNRGWYTITCDYLPNNPGHKLADEYHNISTTDFEGILNLAKKIKPDFVVAYASDPAAPTAAYVSEKLGLPGNSFQSVQVLAEKDLFRSFLLIHGFNSPKSVSIKREENIFEKTSSLQFPIIIKPTDSSGSKGVSKVTTKSEIKPAVEYALTFSRNKRIIAEEFVESIGAQLHGDGFVFEGELIFSYLGDHHYNNKINPFVPFSTSWPSQQNEDTIHKIEFVLKKAIKLLGYQNGPINIEVRITNKREIFIMEIGPRSGGNFVPQVIKYATGFDMVSASLDVVYGKPVKQIFEKKGHVAYYVIHTDFSGILIELSLKDQIKPFIKEFHQYIMPGQLVNSFQGANAAIGVILLAFNCHAEMELIISKMDDFINLKIQKL